MKIKILIALSIMLLFNACSTKFKADNKLLDNKIKKTREGLNSENDYLLNIGANDLHNKKILGNIYFDYNVIKLNKENKDFIDKNIIILNNTKIHLVAYSNEWGNDQYNIDIGLQRLEKVKKYLLSKKYTKKNISIKTIGANTLNCNKNMKNCLEKIEK